jgi:hypothetical protein
VEENVDASTAAHALLTAMAADGGRAPERLAEAIGTGPAAAARVRGLAAAVNVLVAFVDEAYEVAEGDRATAGDGRAKDDSLHRFVPAVVARLATTAGLDRGVVPVLAGVLTAAALDLDAHAWRTGLGPWREPEPVGLALTAWYLCDLIDTVRGQSGFALTLLANSKDLGC